MITYAGVVLDDTLEHHGVKGMKWGVRRDRTSGISSSSSRSVPSVATSGEGQKDPRFTQHQKDMAKKAAIGVGILAVVAGAGYVAYKVNQSGGLHLGEMKKATELSKGEDAAKKILKEQTEVLHATRGKHTGFTFIKTGGIDHSLAEYEKAFGQDTFEDGLFKRYDGKIAASFLDPSGRTDFAGRAIPHQIIVPKSMTDGINNVDDVKTKIFPLLKDAADEIYNRPSRH